MAIDRYDPEPVPVRGSALRAIFMLAMLAGFFRFLWWLFT